MAKLSPSLSTRLFAIRTHDELQLWLADVAKEIGGINKVPLGGISNNVHTVEVAADPALALVERPINGIDAVLELHAQRLNETASTPHEAARRWLKLPKGGFSALPTDKERRALATNIQVTMHESGIGGQPSVSIQDKGAGQHPEDFPKTLLSLLGENKKMKRHVMGVYNAGGAASFKFANGAIVVSRLAPDLLNGRPDEIGMSVVLYNELDAATYKTGRYEYITAKDNSIIRLDLNEMPNGFEFGTYIMLLEYQMPKYSKGVRQPKGSLWQLFHSSLPNPPLPLLIVDRRPAHVPKDKQDEDRVVNGLLHQLDDDTVAKFREERDLDLGTELGSIKLRYFVLNSSVTDYDYYVKAEQGLTLTLNGQRQHAKSRLWLKNETGLHYLYKRLIVVVDCTGITYKARRLLFPSTREMAADTEVTKQILDRVVKEIKEDSDLYDLDEQARDNALAQSTKTTTDKVKKQLASEVSAVIQGQMDGKKGGKPKPKRKPKPKTTRKPRNIDDSAMLEIPDTLSILNSPLKIERGSTNGLRLAINAKNGFIPEKFDDLRVVFGPEVKDHLKVTATGRLLGGTLRVTVQASEDAPLVASTVSVSLMSADLGVALLDKGDVAIVEPKPDAEEEDSSTGGEPNIDIKFVDRSSWAEFSFDGESVGVCNVTRAENGTDVVRVEWVLNADFEPFETMRTVKKLVGAPEQTFRDRYAYALAMGMFNQELAGTEVVKSEEDGDDEESTSSGDVSDSYKKKERARWARAILMAMDPDVSLAQQVADGAEEDGAVTETAATAAVGAD